MVSFGKRIMKDLLCFTMFYESLGDIFGGKCEAMKYQNCSLVHVYF